MARRSGLSRRQETFATLFPARSKLYPQPPHQLGFGEGFATRATRCVSCGDDLRGRHTCSACGAFTCKQCDVLTSFNGGNGERCYRCLL